jgi:hypothetical protein
MTSFIIGFSIIKKSFEDKIEEFVKNSEIGKPDITLEAESMNSFVGIQRFEFINHDGVSEKDRKCLIFRGWVETEERPKFNSFHPDIVKVFSELTEYFDDTKYEIGTLNEE